MRSNFWRRLLIVLCGVIPLPGIAGEAALASFNRPGIGFSAEVLAPGQFAWEQGLPDFSRGQSTRQYAMNTRWRLGVGHSSELHLATNRYQWQRGAENTSGRGDSEVVLKHVLPALREDISWGLMATYSYAGGEQPFTAGGHSRGLAVSVNKALTSGRSLSGYLGYVRHQKQDIWTVSPAWTLYSGPVFSAYSEAGLTWGNDMDSSQVAGGGGTWRITRQVQLDVWFLNGLNSNAADWQGGFGVSWVSR